MASLDNVSPISQGVRHPLSKSPRRIKEKAITPFNNVALKAIDVLEKNSPPFFTLPELIRQLTLDAEVYNGQVGCVLPQKDEDVKIGTI